MVSERKQKQKNILVNSPLNDYVIRFSRNLELQKSLLIQQYIFWFTKDWIKI